MLSKKMAFSLTSLITILALALVVTPVMAGEFDVSLYDVRASNGTAVLMDISHADGLQVERGTNTAIEVTVKFDRGVVVPAANVSVAGYDKDGVLLPAVVLNTADTDDPIPNAPAAQMVTLVITLGADNDAAAMVGKVTIKIAKGIGSHDPFNDDTSKEFKTDIHLLPTDTNAAGPDVWKIALVGEPFSPITTPTFQAHILLSEEPMGGFKADHIDSGESTVESVVKLAYPMTVDFSAIMLRSAANNGGTAETAPTQIISDDGTSGMATWRDRKLHLYLVTFKAKAGEKTVNIKVKDFAGMERPTGAITQQSYVRNPDNMLTAGRDILTVKTKTADPKTPKAAGMKFGLPKDKVIPAGGYLVLAEDKAGSSVHVPPGDIDKTPAPHERNASELIYNVIDDGDLPNLETFLANGGSIGVMGPNALMITEIMWGSDASLDDPGKSQWIELYNAGSEYKTQDGDNTTYLIFYGGGETPAAGLHDLAGTVDAVQGHWSIAGKGQSGASGKRITVKDDKNIDVEATTQAPVISPIISMSRVMTGGTYAKGTLASSWVQSTSPSSNFEANAPGVHIGSPGGTPVTFPEPPAPPPAPAPAAPVAGPMDIKITEIMVDTGSGRLPQWIELTNVSGAEKSLASWSLVITNAEADADVIGETVRIDLSGTLGVGGGEGAGGTMGKSLLLVGGTARSSSNLAGSDRVVDISSQVGQRGRYAFISSIGFMAALIPPQMTGVLAYGDTAGNLGADEAWEIPMDDSGRSSLIRREMDAGMATMGTDANGWVLASSTSLVDGPATWYGSDEDAGTPGYDAGGPLPVELSHFRPARDKATGAVVITWATQSELNNAGFFIKRSQQRDGEFKVINATMIAGAGTTSEKRTYTYTDTTAQPNIVYYYQIEDVSLDGNRQTLTRGIRLKGHIGAAGKLTSTWGELKSSNE
ncbi:MAG: hypothetical protein OXG97_10250 [Candidatus Poribacteria bacterium]|nr:hypothetical protein [Candidatus Poribacteria bacterium]